MRKQTAFAAPPNRHTRESGYPVRRGLSIDHQLLCNTGSPAFAGDDTARDIRCARMRKGPLLQPRPAVIPAKAGIQYAAACRLIISSSAILDRPPSRAMTPRVTFACARIRKRFAFVAGMTAVGQSHLCISRRE